MEQLFTVGNSFRVFVQAMSWTLIHSLWEGLIAAALAGLIILSTKRSKATWRYNGLSAVFILFLIGTFITFLVQSGLFTHSATVAKEISPGLGNVQDAAIADEHWLPSLRKKNLFQGVVYWGNRYSGLIAGVWAMFFFFQLARMAAGLRYAYRLRSRNTSPVAQEWKERMHTLSSLLGIHTRINVKESLLITVPLVVGFLKPIILIPAGMFANLSVEQVETIFVHELAHIRRRDFVVNLLQRLAEAAFFFNPFVNWLSALIREEREACCDDIVLEYTSDRRSYLEALVSFRQTTFAGHPHALALGAKYNLLNRVKRILTNENKNLNVMEKLTLLVAVAGITAFGLMPEKNYKKPIPPTVVSAVTGAISRQPGLPPVPKKPIAPVQFTDTVAPRALTFKNISSSTNDDGTTKTSLGKALGSDGKKYTYKLIDNEISEFSIDDVPVGKANFHKYDWIVAALEQHREESMNSAVQQQKINLDMLQSKQLLLQQQQVEQMNLLQKIKLDNNNELSLKIADDSALVLSKIESADLQKKNLQLLESKLQLNNADVMNEKLRLLQTQQLKLDDQMKLLVVEQPSAPVSSDDIRDIITTLLDKNIITDRDHLSFRLDNEELVVNDKKQPADIYRSLKNRFIKGKKDHYIYQTDGHTTSTDVCK